MKIRPAEKEDLQTLDLCMQELGKFESQFDENIDGNTVIKDNFAPFIEHENGWIHVAEEESEIIGYCCGYYFREFGRKEITAVLDAVYVKEPYRRQGCGTALIKAFFAFAQENNIKYVEIRVLSNNTAACDLYTSLGFAEVEKKLRLTV